jgi:hypothetical protein
MAVVGRELYRFGGLLTSFRRSESVYAFDVTRGTWRAVATRVVSDDMLQDNVIGLPILNVAIGRAPVASVGSRGGRMVVSQGAQTTDDTMHSTSHVSSSAYVGGGGGVLQEHGGLLAPHLSASPLGSSEADRTYDVWSTMSKNDQLFGIARELQQSRELMQQVDSDAAALSARFQLQMAQVDSDRRTREGHRYEDINRSSTADRVASEIEARQSRLRDLMSAKDPRAAEQVHQYWGTELSKLSREHERWRDAAAVDRDDLRRAVTVVDDAPLTLHGGSATASADLMERLRGAVKIAPFVKGGYVSPSVSKLGLTAELARLRQKSSNGPTAQLS